MCLASLATLCDQLDRLTAGAGRIYSDHLGRNYTSDEYRPRPAHIGSVRPKLDTALDIVSGSR